MLPGKIPLKEISKHGMEEGSAVRMQRSLRVLEQPTRLSPKRHLLDRILSPVFLFFPPHSPSGGGVLILAEAVT